MAEPLPRASLMTAIGCLLAAQFFFNCVDSAGKYLVQNHSVVTVIWARSFFHALFMVAYVAIKYSGPPPCPARWDLQVLRGLLLLGFAGFFFAALKYLPQAEAASISFMSPLLMLVLAGPLLGERVTVARWIAVLAGFAGMLVIVRPGSELAPIGIVFAILTVVCNSCFQLITRRLAHSGDPLLTILWTALISTIAATLILPIAPPTAWPNAWDSLLFLSFGLTGSLCHFFLIAAYRRAPASAIAPFIFCHIVYAVIFGWVFFGQFPDALSFTGIAVIVASGAGIALYERARSAVTT